MLQWPDLAVPSKMPLAFDTWRTPIHFHWFENAVEVTKTRNTLVRTRLLAILRSLALKAPLLPDPHDLLRQDKSI